MQRLVASSTLMHQAVLKTQQWHSKWNADWLIRILMMVYENPYKTGQDFIPYIQQRTRVLITNLNYNETSFCVSWDFLDFVENNLKNTKRFPNPISSGHEDASFLRTKLPQHRGVLCSRSHVRNGDRRKLIQWYPMACQIQGITKIFRHKLFVRMTNGCLKF